MVGNVTCDNISTLDATSKWNVTGNSYVTSFADADSTLKNIVDNGFTIYYDASSDTNSRLGGRTIYLAGGGKLTPKS